VWLWAHLYLGLALGPVFVILGVTGTIIAFRPELDEWLNAEQMQVNASIRPDEYASLDHIAAEARRAMPADGRPYALVFPCTPRSAFWVTYSLPAPTAMNPNQLEWHQVFLHARTGAVLGQRLMLDLGRPWRGPFANVAQSVHRTLVLGSHSGQLLGAIAVLLSLSILSGGILWWPPRNQSRGALRIRTNQGPARLTLDLHNVVGVLSAAVLLMSLVTGIYLVQPGWILAPINTVLSTTKMPDSVQSAPGSVALGFDKAATVATGHFQNGWMWMILYPQGERGTYRVFRPSPRDMTDILPSRQIWLDQYTGAALFEFGPHTYTAGDQIEQILYPLHSGEAFGMPGRMMVPVAGLAPLALFITGFLRWRQRVRRTRLSR
jgi:uncharacterized iron-regulated membrane protein